MLRTTLHHHAAPPCCTRVHECLQQGQAGARRRVGCGCGCGLDRVVLVVNDCNTPAHARREEVDTPRCGNIDQLALACPRCEHTHGHSGVIDASLIRSEQDVEDVRAPCAEQPGGWGGQPVQSAWRDAVRCMMQPGCQHASHDEFPDSRPATAHRPVQQAPSAQRARRCRRCRRQSLVRMSACRRSALC